MIVALRLAGDRPLAAELEHAGAGFAAAARTWTSPEPPHVWVFDLRGAALDGTCVASSRAARRAESLVARLVARALLHAYAPSAPVLRFGRRPGGKPMACTAAPTGAFRAYNLAHAHGILAAAIVPEHAPEVEVGVDVEVVGDGDRGALRTWAREEARRKCVGVGLGAWESAPDVARALAATSVADLSEAWGVRPGWPELALALAWSD